MRLVLDTNILIAALIKNSLTRQFFFLPDLEFLLPEYALDVPFVALALAMDNDGIWSKDRAFENLPGITL